MNNLTIITLSEPGITDYSAGRNRALSQVKTDWVLFLDDDESLSPELEMEIERAIHNSRHSAYRLHRLDTFLGRALRHGENGRNTFVRLARADWGRWERPVHEVWVGEGEIGELKHPLIHRLPSVSGLLDKINHYSTLEAEYRYREGVKSSLLHIALYSPAKFIRNYIFRLGFVDGTPGLIMAVLMSFHSYLTWTKLYILCRQK
jgi:glycosyltransferase involved in cell wall biosynthesis